MQLAVGVLVDADVVCRRELVEVKERLKRVVDSLDAGRLRRPPAARAPDGLIAWDVVRRITSEDGVVRRSSTDVGVVSRILDEDSLAV